MLESVAERDQVKALDIIAGYVDEEAVEYRVEVAQCCDAEEFKRAAARVGTVLAGGGEISERHGYRAGPHKFIEAVVAGCIVSYGSRRGYVEIIARLGDETVIATSQNSPIIGRLMKA